MSPSQPRADHIVDSHSDVVGSLLRPDWLLRARRRRDAAEISAAEFAAIEDRAVSEAVVMQEEAGLAVVSDGEMSEFIRLGATYIQLDAPHYPLLLDSDTRAFYESRGWSLDRWLSTGIELDNAVIGDFSSDITFSMHLCRGNQQSRWLVKGGYDEIARQIFQKVKVHRLLLEYDDDRSGSFEPLRLVPHDKMVVLGLVSTKTGNLESKSDLIERVHEAGHFFPRDQLAISPQCGFASSIAGNHLTIEEQRAKLRLVADVAAEVWG